MSTQNGIVRIVQVFRSRFGLLLSIFLLLASVASPAITVPIAEAATFTVDSTADIVDLNPGDGSCDDGNGECTLRAAIMEANAWPGPDTINLPAATYLLTIAGANEDSGATGDLDITDALIIDGAGLTNTIVDGDGLDRVFHLHCNLGCFGGGTVSLAGLTIRKGAVVGVHPFGVGGGIYNDLDELSLTNVTVSDNTAEGSGGGLRNEGGDVLVTSSIFSGNQSIGGSGGISHVVSSEITLYRSMVENNIGESGGGISNNGTLIVVDSKVINNRANGGSAGGIGTGNRGFTTIRNSEIKDNRATLAGGGMHGGVSITINGSMISGNVTDLRGGGISGGEAVTITDTTISDNTATVNGGGISSAGAVMNITNSTISGNEVLSGPAGGINNGTDGSSNGGVLTIVNSTISGNVASDRGGGISSAGESTLNLINVTIAGNIADSDADGIGNGGGIHSRSLTNVNVKSTIIARNSSPPGSNVDDCVGPLNSLGHNLIEDISNCTIIGDTTGNITGQDPILGPLQDNGGPTKTHALLPGSPAIDTVPEANCADLGGNPIDFDQRGFSRWDSACDMGSFESGATPPRPITLFPLTAEKSVLQTHFLTAFVVDINGVPVGGREVTFQVTTGPNAGEVSNPNTGECIPKDDCTTDSSGSVGFSYLGDGGDGTDTIVASFVDDDGVTQTSLPVEMVWLRQDPVSITLLPLIATNLVLQTHFLTSRVVDINDVPVGGREVTFQVTSGPNAGEVSNPNAGECTPNDDCTTDSNGSVGFSYIGDGGLGKDTIVASFVDNNGATPTAAPVEMEWKPGPPTQIFITHTIRDTETPGQDHSVTAVVADSNNFPVGGREVTFRVTAGPNAGEVSNPNTGECAPNDDCTTDSNGSVGFSYTGRCGPGTDTTIASFVDDGGVAQTSHQLETVWTQKGFPCEGTDSFLSIAVFEVILVDGDNLFTPLLLDFNTLIGRSGPLDEDTPAPETLEEVCSSLTLPPAQECVDVVFPEGFGGVGRREVETEILSLNLERAGSGFSVKAGQAALDFLTNKGEPELFTPSLGEVESLDLTGDGAPATDFPADSFFNVYAVVETPLGPPMFNQDPLLVVSRGITGFPPVAFYPHESLTSEPVPLYWIDDPDGLPVAFLRRAVHGTEAEELIGVPVNDHGFDDFALDKIVNRFPPTTVVTPKPNAAGWHKTDVTLNFIATDLTAAGETRDGVAFITVIVNGVSQPCPPGPTCSVDLIGGGTYKVEFYATDNDGNSETPNRQNHNIDKTPPTPVHDGPFTVEVGNTILLDGTASTDGLSGVLSTAWAINGDGVFDDGDPSSFTASGGPGIYDVFLKVIDVAGNLAIADTKVEVFGRCGDQNGDGNVDIFDAIIDLQIIVGLIEPTPEQLMLSDVTGGPLVDGGPATWGDGRINIFDVILTLQHIVGLVENLDPCGPPPA